MEPEVILAKAVESERFDKFLTHISEGKLNECWEWVGPKLCRGYGLFNYRYKTVYAHRAAYEFAYGEIPTELEVMHLCHNKSCVNPNHLKLGTIGENTAHNGISGRRRVDNTTGIVGVRYIRNKWQARCVVKGRETTLYHGPDFFEACCARKSWESGMTKAFLGVQ
jgi:hypothetical protein